MLKQTRPYFLLPETSSDPLSDSLDKNLLGSSRLRQVNAKGISL